MVQNRRIEYRTLGIRFSSDSYLSSVSNSSKQVQGVTCENLFLLTCAMYRTNTGSVSTLFIRSFLRRRHQTHCVPAGIWTFPSLPPSSMKSVCLYPRSDGKVGLRPANPRKTSSVIVSSFLWDRTFRNKIMFIQWETLSNGTHSNIDMLQCCIVGWQNLLLLLGILIKQEHYTRCSTYL